MTFLQLRLVHDRDLPRPAHRHRRPRSPPSGVLSCASELSRNVTLPAARAGHRRAGSDTRCWSYDRCRWKSFPRRRCCHRRSPATVAPLAVKVVVESPPTDAVLLNNSVAPTDPLPASAKKFCGFPPGTYGVLLTMPVPVSVRVAAVPPPTCVAIGGGAAVERERPELPANNSASRGGCRWRRTRHRRHPPG